MDESGVMATASKFQKAQDCTKQPSDPNFIGNVKYPRQCKGLCERDTTPEVLAMQQHLLQGLSSRCSFKALHKDMVVACEVACRNWFRSERPTRLVGPFRDRVEKSVPIETGLN
jgi:hypothetical protein